MINLCFIRLIQFFLICVILLFTVKVQAQRPEYHVTIKNHLFYPEKIVIPANRKVKLIINNKDKNIEEFDSFDLNREKVIFPNRKRNPEE